MTDDVARPDRHLLGRWTPWIVVLVLAGIGVGAATVWRQSGRSREPAKLDSAFVYDVERYRIIPADQIGYREVARYETDLLVATALTVGPEGRIVAAGDEKVLVFTPQGKLTATIPATDTVYALALAYATCAVAKASAVVFVYGAAAAATVSNSIPSAIAARVAVNIAAVYFMVFSFELEFLRGLKVTEWPQIVKYQKCNVSGQMYERN